MDVKEWKSLKITFLVKFDNLKVVYCRYIVDTMFIAFNERRWRNLKSPYKSKRIKTPCYDYTKALECN